MSDRIASKWKWSGALLLGLGVGAVAAVAGGIMLAVYYVRNRRQSATPAPTREQPLSPPVLQVQEVPVVAIEEVEVGSGFMGSMDYSPQLQEYNVHTLKSFPPDFQGSTYQDVHTEIMKWVQPLHCHPRLHAAFLGYSLPPKLHEKLHLLSETLQKMANALGSGNKPPENLHKTLSPILNELSTDPGVKMDQIKSLIIVSEAFKEFPRHIVEMCIKSLPSEKRQQLVEFIQTVPYGIDKRIFTEPDSTAIFMDPNLQPIMTRIGFSKPAYSSDLTWDAADDEDEDRLVAGLFLLAGSDRQ